MDKDYAECFRNRRPTPEERMISVKEFDAETDILKQEAYPQATNASNNQNSIPGDPDNWIHDDGECCNDLHTTTLAEGRIHHMKEDHPRETTSLLLKAWGHLCQNHPILSPTQDLETMFIQKTHPD